MATKLIHLKCQNCGANLDLDLDKLMAFCPYCGAKLMIDIDQIGSVLVEKEKTNRVSKLVDSVENVANEVISYKAKKEEMKHESEKVTKEQVIALIAVLIFCLIMYLTSVRGFS